MIHHVVIEVSDLPRSASFYDALLSPLGNDGAWLWVYRDHDGRVVSPAITSIDDVVVAAHDRLAPNPPNDDNRWHGASIEEVTAALGPGRIEARDTTAVRVRFGELAFEFVAGRVLRRAD